MNRGFSLVELSIVLVILGLLVGGILAGQSLIRAAELRSVSTELTKLETAIMTFRDKYFALPGDMANASKVWGPADGADGTGSDCGDIISTGITTCDGNGNGQVYTALSNGVYERYRIWQHLANAGLIEGSYVGAPESGQAYLGRQHYTSRLKNAGYEISYQTVIYKDWNQHSIKLASKLSTDTTGLNGGAIKAEEAWNLDTKMDDGSSYQGRISATGTNCVTNGTTITLGTTGSYVLTDSSNACVVRYFPSF